MKITYFGVLVLCGCTVIGTFIFGFFVQMENRMITLNLNTDADKADEILGRINSILKLLDKICETTKNTEIKNKLNGISKDIKSNSQFFITDEDVLDWKIVNSVQAQIFLAIDSAKETKNEWNKNGVLEKMVITFENHALNEMHFINRLQSLE
ncbi:hypothetical protein TCON_0267 [Astathelohania contejeani]|uniref:Uncharacterized protein n=1 Tax=Astathelohania contejeani TaxID=164912 RepID=A0ABQ7I2A8_9MICR|nr:hypothetical protein TCON_0267 [Thelohania contejeani]